ncbi:dienelactone hydrolase family protein [Oceanibaculum indicum]|uniref:Dienelactone hydrolase n=1 Tax=Oceanibaculum indicum P24 TaxID=1207063 RepID=K2K364_9PROT|nr:dienelactone hydrolase family protein [Oceanibaculum indicum]EKE77344.1 dienelactone hydrolase [Oceanibaculum indicum P24]
MRRFLWILLAACLLPATAHARLASGDWPDGAAISAIDGQPVSFESRSPFSPRDIGQGEARNPMTLASGQLFLPDRASSRDKVPAVVLIHGAGGVRYGRELTYGRQFAAMGIAALVVDAFAARRELASGFTERLLNITETMLVADVYAGLRYLAGRGDIDTDRIALIGFSYGGMASTYALHEQIAKSLAPEGLRFAGHVAFYGPCVARFADKRTTGAPYLMLYGGQDALIDPERCQEVLADIRAGGSQTDVVVYDEAYHLWDGSWRGPRRISRNLAGCSFEVSQSGLVRDRNTLLPMLGPVTRRLILAACVTDDGYLIGGDPDIRQQSNAVLGRFLARLFGFPLSAEAG